MKKQFSLWVLYWLKFWAKLQVSKIKPIIIGVTGSAGKSTCVAAIEAILKQKYSVKTTGTSNSESGIPLSILGLQMVDYSLFDWLRVIFLAPFSIIRNTKYMILVCEMGIDELTSPKNMSYLLTIVQPKIGVFLNVLPAHTQQMKNLENIAAEKGKLIASLPANGTAIVNKNDARTHIKTKAKTIYFSGDSISAAKAVGKIFGINKMPNFNLPPGRGNIFAGINGSRIIDSSYNSSPVPTKNTLEKLKFEKNLPAGRRVAVLGDMRELGEIAESEHKKVAKEAIRHADEVITVGPLWKKYAKFDNQFDNFYQTGKFLQKFLKKGDVVLFKGSQNTIFLEGAVEMCLANPADAVKLCRRGKFWDKQREKYGQKN